jgi:response regulator RpfG family c-di-GMP phosphodiesterase
MDSHRSKSIRKIAHNPFKDHADSFDSNPVGFFVPNGRFSNMSTHRRPILLVVHYDNQVLRQIAKMVSEIAEVIAARGAGRTRAILDSDQIVNAAIVGKTGDGISAIDVLCIIRDKRPQARSILLNDPRDLSASIEALHGGVVDHVLSAPLRERDLTAILALPAPRILTLGPAVRSPGKAAGMS